MNHRPPRLRTPLALVLILAIVTGALAPTGHSLSPPATQAQTDPVAMVALFAAINYGGERITFTTSQPDLSVFGGHWTSNVTAISVQGGIAVAAYTGTDYTGTCEPFIGNDPSLVNNRIGNDTIKSVRLHATCTEENVYDPVVTEITAVTGDSAQTYCPFDYVQKNQDLNEGVGGDWVYLCLRIRQQTSSGPGADYVRRVEVVISLTPTTSDPWCFDASNLGTDAHFLAVDLNEGAGGSYVYLCYWTANQSWVDHGVTSATGVMRDFEFAVDTSFLSDSEILSDCRSDFPDFRAGYVEENSIQVVRGNGVYNLNDLASLFSGPNIYMCALTYSGALTGPPDTAPPTITFAGRTPPNANGWNNTAVTLTWNCADAGSGPVATTVTQTLSAEGANQSVIGTCVDNNGNTASDTQTGINIDLTPPGVGFGGHPATYNQGDQVVISCVASDSLSGIQTDCQGLDLPANDFGVGQTAVTFSATDRAGNTGTVSTNFEVLNVAPALVAPILSPAPSSEGESVAVRALYTDPGILDSHLCTLTWGDGTSTSGNVTQTPVDGVKACEGMHVYGDDGAYAVSVEVCDEYGGCDQSGATQTVNNVAPSITALGGDPDPSTETGNVTLAATFSDPGTQDTFTCAIDWGDGSAVEPGQLTGLTCSGTHVYADDNPSNSAQDDYTISVQVCDDGGDCANAGTLQTVMNLPPVIDQITAQSGSYGQPLMVSVAAHDPSSADSLSYAFDCNDDGTFELGPQPSPSATCIVAPGTLSPQVRVRVSDDDLGVTDETLTLALSGRTFCAGLTTGALSLGDAGCAAYTRPVVVRASAPTTLCASSYTAQLSHFLAGCPAGWRSYVVPGINPIPICVSSFTGALRLAPTTGPCPDYHRPDVIPGS